MENVKVIRAQGLRPEETSFGLHAIPITTFQVEFQGSLMAKKVQDVIESFWRRAGLGHVSIATSRFEPWFVWNAAWIFKLIVASKLGASSPQILSELWNYQKANRVRYFDTVPKLTRCRDDVQKAVSRQSDNFSVLLVKQFPTLISASINSSCRKFVALLSQFRTDVATHNQTGGHIITSFAAHYEILGSGAVVWHCR